MMREVNLNGFSIITYKLIRGFLQIIMQVLE